MRHGCITWQDWLSLGRSKRKRASTERQHWEPKGLKRWTLVPQQKCPQTSQYCIHPITANSSITVEQNSLQESQNAWYKALYKTQIKRSQNNRERLAYGLSSSGADYESRSGASAQALQAAAYVRHYETRTGVFSGRVPAGLGWTRTGSRWPGLLRSITFIPPKCKVPKTVAGRLWEARPREARPSSPLSRRGPTRWLAVAFKVQALQRRRSSSSLEAAFQAQCSPNMEKKQTGDNTMK